MFKEMLLSLQYAKKKIKVNWYCNSVFNVGDYVAFQLKTKDKNYFPEESCFDEDYFRAMDGKYVIIRKIQDHISYRSKILPEVADHWIICQLYCGFFDEILDMSRLKDSNWAYVKGGKIHPDTLEKNIYLLCESSFFHFKKRNCKIIGNDRKGIDEMQDYHSIAQAVYLGVSSCYYNGDTFLISSILRSKTVCTYLNIDRPEKKYRYVQKNWTFGEYI